MCFVCCYGSHIQCPQNLRANARNFFFTCCFLSPCVKSLYGDNQGLKVSVYTGQIKPQGPGDKCKFFSEQKIKIVFHTRWIWEECDYCIIFKLILTHKRKTISTSQGLRASSLQFTSPLEFNAIFRDGFTLLRELTAGSKIRDPVPAKFKHVTNIVTCTLICCDYITYVPALKFPKSWLRTLGYWQKTHHFFFSHKWGTRFKYLSKLCPYILMYSALHIMQ